MTLFSRQALLSYLLLLTASQLQAKPECSVDPRTDAYTCIDTAMVKESKGIRFAELYTGGPNGIRKTKFTVHTNCKTNVSHLKDRDGVSFAGGGSNSTATIAALSSWMCDAKIKK